MHLIVYASTFEAPLESEHRVLRDIIAVSRRENPKWNITGVLFFFEGKFLQVLEGMEDDLRALMRNIERDARHRDMQYLVDRGIPRKSFQTWNMECFGLSDAQRPDAETVKKLTVYFEGCLEGRENVVAELRKKLLEKTLIGIFT